MSLKVELGLFNLDFIDYHAILGVPVNADLKDIRKQYLNIARRLHPDSSEVEGDVDRQRATEYLSKLVNPAYEKLSQEKNYPEYCLLLKMKGQQAVRQQETVMLVSDSARRLASATGDIEQPYRIALRELIGKQYQQLEQTLELTGYISELNLVYLMRKAKQEPIESSPPRRDHDRGVPPPPPPPPPRSSPVDAYLRRAKQFEAKQDYTNAIKELRDGLQAEPTSSACHISLAEIYIKTRQTTMAKIHFNQALKINPKDPVALEGIKKLDQSNGGGSGKGSKPAPKGDKPNNSGGGLFGMFGGKKK